ncbi:MAG: LPS export ABC transporter permease LptF [Deltaproteobacteria bacterium]|nr:LPS export ABC transporter permease LptF [Deltaproteobacteria bacterium]MBZ0220189.1 LPS export ABC transporter permease LptF [Deltaproteobacteria bacterium]
MRWILGRYILKEIWAPFLLSLVILTAISLLTKAVRIIELLLVQGVGGGFILWFIVSVLPSLLLYTLPIAFLIGVLVAFTRLSSDSELTAMKASGLSLYAALRPVLLFAAFVYAASLLVTLYLFPWGNLTLKNLVYEASKDRFISGLEEKTFYDSFKGFVIYIDKINLKSGEMEGIFISESGGEGEPNLFFAAGGVFSPATDRHTVYLKLNDGVMHRKTEGDGTYHIANFSSYTLELGLSGQPGAASERRNKEMYAGELRERIELAKASGEDPSRHIIDLHKRFAIPSSVFVFALLGLPLGLQKIRVARFTGFSIAIGVVLVYYLLSTGFEALGESGSLNPFVAVWATDFIFLVAGLFVFSRTSADRSANPLTTLRGGKAR